MSHDVKNGAENARDKGDDERRHLPGTPFIVTPSNCPICKTVSDQYSFRNDIFLVAEKDVDLRPTTYLWKNKKFEDVKPLLYFPWQCPHCLFSACEHYFERPTIDVTLSSRQFKRKIHELLFEDEDFKFVSVFIREEFDPMAVTHELAVRRLLTAILIFERISTIRNRDSLPLARYFLHLSWLLRDLGEKPELAAEAAMLDDFQGAVADHWPELTLNEDEALRKALSYYENTYYNSRIPERRNIVHNVTQLLGRINIKLENLNEGRNFLWLSIQHASEWKKELEDSISESPNEQRREHLIRGVNKCNSFISETQELLYLTRARKKEDGA